MKKEINIKLQDTWERERERERERDMKPSKKRNCGWGDDEREVELGYIEVLF
jgi:hypothetical protein